MSFVQNLQTEEGVEVLLKKLKNSCKNLQIYIEVLEKEVEILEFTSEKYKKISLKSSQMSEDFKSLVVVGLKIQENFLEKSKILEQSLDSLRRQVLEPLQSLLLYQTQARKSHKQNLDKALKAKQSAELAFYKSKDKYFLRQKELLSLKGGYVTLNAKEALKRDQRIDKLTREIEQLDVEYQHNG